MVSYWRTTGNNAINNGGGLPDNKAILEFCPCGLVLGVRGFYG